MKSILLTTTALVAFAGAAAAEGHTSITHALSGELGYNSENDGIGEDGFFWEGNLKTTATATLDGGLTAGAYFEATIEEDDGTAANDKGMALASSDFVLSLTSDTASLYFGDTSTAATKHWKSAGDMESDNFTTDTNSAVLRGDASFGGFNGSISYIIDDSAANDTANQLSVGASGAFGNFTVALAYEEATTYADGNGDFNADEKMGISVGGTFGGATVTLAYVENSTAGKQSTGIQVAYPFGPVTATVYYVMEDTDAGDVDDNYGLTVAYASGPVSATAKFRNEQGRDEWNLEGSYDVGNGLTVMAGLLNEDETDVDYYLGGSYDLGGGAAVTAVYAVDDNGDQGDEIGSGEYDPGMTVAVSFSF